MSIPKYLRVRKDELPIPLVVESEEGVAVLSIEPAGKNKLGARLGAASQAVISAIKRFLKIA